MAEKIEQWVLLSAADVVVVDVDYVVVAVVDDVVVVAAGVDTRLLGEGDDD